MNVDDILQALNDHEVDYLLIGGMNFLLRHEPVTTYDVDIWIDDTEANCQRCEQALQSLDAEWGATDAQWGLVAEKPAGWIRGQSIICLTSPFGAIDIFRSVRGLSDWRTCAARALPESTSSGTDYRGLSDADMLECQLALDDALQKKSRIDTLRRALQSDIDTNE